MTAVYAEFEVYETWKYLKNETIKKKNTISEDSCSYSYAWVYLRSSGGLSA